MTHPAHGGNVRRLAEAAGVSPDRLLDFSASINPLGPPAWLREVLSRAVEGLVHYPDPEARELKRAASLRYGCRPEEVVACSGTSEVLHVLPSLDPGRRAVALAPSYSGYLGPWRARDLHCLALPLDPEAGFVPDLELLAGRLLPGDICYLGTPNNPTGQSLSGHALAELAQARPDCLLVVDEAFADFTNDPDRLSLMGSRRPGNVIVLLSLTKFFAVPGLRLGLALAEPELAARITALLPEWSVSSLAQAVGVRAMRPEDPDGYLSRTIDQVAAWREELARGLVALPGMTVYSSKANFLLVRAANHGLTGSALARRLLLEHALAVRDCSDFERLGQAYLRVAVRTPEENDRLLEAMAAVLGAERAPKSRPGPRTPAIMLQGTGSGAGKSILAAALCRVLRQDGYQVAPFKAQNMSNNSCVTWRGEEMGRAQALQARACGMEPEARMNPVLLKPGSDIGSQVVVMGRVVGNMSVAEYYRYKDTAFEEVKRAYDGLASEHEVMILEGAGSPAEVNLKRHDIVNMRMARYAGARVLLVGDIDRGGVFAALTGTMECLDEEERRLVAGYVLNKFRGDPALLAEALEFMVSRTGRDVLGVVPYIPDLGLPDEDSVSFREPGWGGRLLDGGPGLGEVVDVAVVDLPRVSNFTDFDPLLAEPDVRVRAVRAPAELGQPDAVILPGSKATAPDLDWLERTGLAQAILDLVRQGRTVLVGICGGYQMLGRDILDPLGLESDPDRPRQGLGLLPLTTTLARDKSLRRTTCTHVPTGLLVKGYEIHHGVTEALGGEREVVPILLGEDGAILGFSSPDGLVWGGYLHGLFESDELRRSFVDSLRARRGLAPLGRVVARYDIEPALDRLAEVVRLSLDMDRVYALLGLGRS